MKNLVLLFTCCMVSISIYGQANLSGEIKSEQYNALPGVHVWIENSKIQTVTDENGIYTLYNIPTGKQNLVVSYIGYTDINVALNIMDGDQTQDVTFTGSNTLDEIVINGQLEGQAKALNERKNRSNISDIIASQQIERFPDANVGDALKRLSGINVQYDQGEARFANIRGTAPELSSITINGERVPSAEAEKRFVQLDLVPADMVSTIEVNKAVTPDLDGDAIGGSINLVTRKASETRTVKGTLGSGYSFLTQKPLLKGKLSFSDRFAENKIGIIASVSILDKFIRSDNVESEWEFTDENNQDASAFTSDLQIRQYELERLRQSYSVTMDYQIHPNHNIYIGGIYNWRNDYENRYRLRYKDIEEVDGQMTTEIRRQTKGGVSGNKYGRLEDQRMKSLRIGGDHFFGKLKLNWAAFSSKASEDRPNERYISMRNKDVPVTLNLADRRNPMLTISDPKEADLSDNYSLREVTEEFQYTEEEDMSFRIDLQRPVMYGENSSFIKIGGKVKNKSKLRDNSFKEYAPVNEEDFETDAISNISSQTNDDFSVGNYEAGNFVTKEFLGDLNFNNGFEGEIVLEELAGNFSAEEDVLAVYTLYNQNIGRRLNLIAGARYEQTKVNYTGKIFDGEIISDSGNQSEDYSNFLPGVHLNYRLTDWTNFRFAWSNTIARPNYFDLVPYQEINTEDNEIAIGNPSLEATTSMNLDLMVEHFFKNIGIISMGVYYKDLTNVISNTTQNDYDFQGVTYDQFSQPINAGNADLIGIEIGVQRRLDFLPGKLKALSFYANYTYNKSELKNIALEDREEETIPLVGTPPNLLNVSLAWDSKKLDARLSLNSADSFIEEYGDQAFYDRWYDKVAYLDFNADYKLIKQWSVYCSINNLLDQPLRYYQGVEDRTMQVEYYGINSRVGVKFRY